MMQITNVSDGSDIVVLCLEGDVTIETVGEVRDAILQAFSDAAHIKINCDSVTNIDFFGLQILCSAHRTSVVKKKLLTWDGTRPAHLNEMMSKAGFTRHCGCNLCPVGIDCIWL